MAQVDLQSTLLRAGPVVVAAGIAFLLYNHFKKSKNAGQVNLSVAKDKAKVVDVVDIEDLDDKNAFCRCWRSKKWPHCDCSHVQHNKETGDNVGPLCINRKCQ